MFHYAEVCIGAKDRGKIYDMRKVDNNRAVGMKDVYVSMFRFDDSIIRYIREKRTIRGYEGKAMSEWLYIDIDDDDLESARRKAIATFQNIEDAGIDLTTCRVFFSGSKGFHIAIPSLYFLPFPSEDVPQRFKRMAQHLSPNCDLAIYNFTRIFRLENTINTKSGLYKVELYPSEVINGTVDTIKQIATKPRKALEIDDFVEPIEELRELYHSEFKKEKPKQSTFEAGSGLTKYKPCIAKMLASPDCNERNNTAVRIVTHLKEVGLTYQMAYSVLNDWNNNLHGPLDDRELETVFNSTWNGTYSFGCNDALKKANCSAICMFYKEEFKNDRGRGI